MWSTELESWVRYHEVAKSVLILVGWRAVGLCRNFLISRKLQEDRSKTHIQPTLSRVLSPWQASSGGLNSTPQTVETAAEDFCTSLLAGAVLWKPGSPSLCPLREVPGGLLRENRERGGNGFHGRWFFYERKLWSLLSFTRNFQKPHLQWVFILACPGNTEICFKRGWPG